jgi:hypothetical protein
MPHPACALGHIPAAEDGGLSSSKVRQIEKENLWTQKFLAGIF